MGIVAKYKYDGSVYADLIPEFNAEFTDYTITDEVEGNIITRTIESDKLPTLMRFGRMYIEGESATDNRTDSLLEVLDMNTSGLTDCNMMFRFNTNLTSITCEWDTSNVTTMYGMFHTCTNLTSLDLSNFNTSNVITMNRMFSNCTNLTSLDVSNFDTSNVTDINRMFTNCNKLTSLDLSNFNTSNVTDTTNILTNTNNLKYLKCNNVTTLNTLNTYLPTKVSDNQGIIICKSDITNLDITTLQSKYWTVNTNPTLIAKYKYDSKIYKNLIPVFNEGYMGFVEDEEVDANGVVTRKIEHVELPTLMRFGSMSGSSNPRSKSLLQILNMNTRNLTTALRMFRYCLNLTSINCDWNTSKITDLRAMFEGCLNLEILDTNWDTSNVTTMGYCFHKCHKLTALNLSSWNTKKVTDITHINNFDKLTSLDISNFTILTNTNTIGFLSFVPNLTDIGMIYCDQSTINKVASLLPTDHNITIWVESDDILQYDQYDHITYKTQKVQDTVHLNSPLLMGDTIEVIDGKTYHVHRYEEIQYQDCRKYHDQTDLTQAGIRLFKLRHDARYESTGYKHEYNLISEKAISVQGSGECLELNRIYTTIDGNIWLSIEANTEITLEEAKQRIGKTIGKLVTPYYELISEEPLELTLLDTTDNTINNNSILPSNMTIANKELSTIAIKPSTTYTLSFDKSNVDSEVTIDICGGEQITTVLNRIELTTPSELGSGIRFISSDGCVVNNVRLLEGSLVKEAIPKETFEGLQSSFDDGYIIGEVFGSVTRYWEWSTSSRNYDIPLNKTISNTIITIATRILSKNSNPLGIKATNNSHYVTGRTVNANIGFNLFLFEITNPANMISLYRDGSGEGYIIDSTIILEGDHTHLSEAELMRYIEKGTSHYEEEDYNHVGKYKVEYRVTGKNKFDGSKSIFSSDYNSYIQCFKVNPNTTYTYNSSYTDYITLSCYKEYNIKHPEDSSNKDNILFRNAVKPPFTITTPPNCNYIWLNHASIGSYFVQIEEGTVATEYEPYKEDIKTYYLSSPFLEGDTIEDVNGVATHVKRYEKMMLDENSSYNNKAIFTNDQGIKYLLIQKLKGLLYNRKGISDKRVVITGNQQSLTSNNQLCLNAYKDYSYACYVATACNTYEEFITEIKNDPITLIYQLASPIYEPISDKSILCDSYINGHLDFDSAIPVKKVMFRYFVKELAYLQPSTNYIIQFNSDNIGECQIGISGVYYIMSSVVKGRNICNIITPSELVHKNIIIHGIGFNASNIQVVATNKDIDFGYFKGLQSSFEDGLVTDENDENYGKYKVECKIVGKNVAKLPQYYSTDRVVCEVHLVKGKTYRISSSHSSWLHSGQITIREIIDKTTSNNSTEIMLIKDWGSNFVSTFVSPVTGVYWYYVWNPNIGTWLNDTTDNVWFQLEEGTQATSYEPYKESIHTLYLNSPLLKGDKLVVHDGKLCHYHKMGMIVLDGNENWYLSTDTDNYLDFRTYNIEKPLSGGYGICDRFKYLSNQNGYWIASEEGLTVFTDNKNNSIIFSIQKSRLSTHDINGFKQWLQANSTTVVYELAIPYYEPIEPQLSSNSFSTVKDGDMEIITVLPIEKINLTYRTDINGVSSIEEQIASIQEGTDISSIIDEEVDE